MPGSLLIVNLTDSVPFLLATPGIRMRLEEMAGWLKKATAIHLSP